MTDQPHQNPPNVILILADDMGFSDLGCTGSEIKTPHLDQLAKDGVLMTSMYNCARCCPTRGSLLTGRYPHDVGIGHMGTDLGLPAYQGFLKEDSPTIAEHLRQSGYHTFMSGKWHVGGDYTPHDYASWQPGSPKHPTPRQRGFDRFYGILDGAAHFFSPHYLMEDDKRVYPEDDDYYITDAITDKAISMIDSVDDSRPFFLYLAHLAPHWPLHAPEVNIATYDGVYKKGWDHIRKDRFERMHGLLPYDTALSPRDEDALPWEDAPHPDWEAAKMATYAAMVDRMDQSIGRLITYLKAHGLFENTLIMFLSDNGGCAEFMAEDGWAQFYPDTTFDGQKVIMGNDPEIRPGSAQSFQSYDKPWANVSNAPFRLFKHYVHEGGIATPLIAHWPAGFKSRDVSDQPCHVSDILPTILQAAKAKPIAELNGIEAQAIQGESFLNLLKNLPWQREAPIFFEHEGNAAIRLGDFKLVRLHEKDWELYEISQDRSELQDIFHKDPKRAQELIALYEDWAQRSGVMNFAQLLPKLLNAWGLQSADG